MGLVWRQQRGVVTASVAIRALQDAGISMGPPRQMVENEWDNVPLRAQQTLTFSVGDLRGCYGCSDPMAYVLYVPDAQEYELVSKLVLHNISRSTEPDWALQYEGLIVILPAGLSQTQVAVYRQVLDQLVASGPSLTLPKLDILSKSDSG